MKKIIIYFTNSNKFKTLINNQIIRISIDGKIEIGVSNCSLCKVYVLHDETNINLDNIIPTKDFNGFFIYHSATDRDLIKKLTNKKFTSIEDRNEPEGSTIGKGYYLWLSKIPRVATGRTFEFIDEIDKTVFNELWSKLEKKNDIDKALELLHNIYNGDIINTNKLSPELKKQFKAHYNINKEYSDKYDNQLVELREAILEEKLS